MPLKLLRKQKQVQEIFIDSDSFFEKNMEFQESEHLESIDEQEYKIVQIEHQIEGLMEEQRICVELFYVKQMCYKEIAEHTGYTLNQVKSYIQNGKRNIQQRVVKS